MVSDILTDTIKRLEDYARGNQAEVVDDIAGFNYLKARITWFRDIWAFPTMTDLDREMRRERQRSRPGNASRIRRHPKKKPTKAVG